MLSLLSILGCWVSAGESPTSEQIDTASVDTEDPGETGETGETGDTGEPDPLLEGLVGWWTFDGSGTDHSGNTNDGVWSGGIASPDHCGRSGEGVYLTDGANLEIPDDDTLHLPPTVTLWFKRMGDTEVVLAKGPETDLNFALGVGADRIGGTGEGIFERAIVSDPSCD